MSKSKRSSGAKPQFKDSLEDVPTRKKIAIIGSGAAGMGAAYGLSKTHHDVHIFEREDRLGGHTNTQRWTSPSEPRMEARVDTGFIVLNTATYPNFINFLEDVDVPVKTSEMTFSVSRKHPNFEWSGSAKGVFAQYRNLFRPRHWRMLFDIVRFNQFAPDLLVESKNDAYNLTIGEYLNREKYSQAFKDDYLIPMTAAVWSTSPDKASLDFPAETLVRFMWNHHLLSTVSARPDWLTIEGGAQDYIDAICGQYSDERLSVHLCSEVVSLVRPSLDTEEPVKMYWRVAEENPYGGAMTFIESDSFDHVIMACHGDEILPILQGGQASNRKDSKARSAGSHSSRTSSFGNVKEAATETERNVLNAKISLTEFEIFESFKTTANVCYLHSDLSLMPTRRNTWSSWNYLINARSPSQLSTPAGVSLTYNMNILQHIPRETFGDVLVTMNPGHPPKPDLVQGIYHYRHPLYTVAAIKAQRELRHVQNRRGVSFCGAWTKYGFHEDGFTSGLEAAVDHLGARLPFELVDSTYSRGKPDDLAKQDHALRAALRIMSFLIRTGEYVLAFPVISWVMAIIGFILGNFLDGLEWAGLLA